MYEPKEKHDPFADGCRIMERVEQWKKDNPEPPKTDQKKTIKKHDVKKNPTLRKGVKIFQWNGIDNDEGVVIKKSKEYLYVDWDGTEEKIEVDLFTYRMKVIDGKAIWRWKPPPKEVDLIFETKIEGEWENTYDHNGKLITMRLLETPGR